MADSRTTAVVMPRAGILAGAVRRLEVGRETTPPGREFAHRRIGSLTLVWTEAGRAVATVNGIPVEHAPGTRLACAPDFALDERGADDVPWTAAWIMLDGAWAAALAEVLAQRPGGMLLCAPAPRRWVQLARSVLDLAAGQPAGWEWSLATALADLSGRLVAAAAGTGETGGLATRVAALVDRNPDRAWNLDGLAKALGIGRSALAHRFSHEAGVGVATFVRRRRCQHARVLLLSGCSVAEAAERSGFANAFHFSRAYRTAMGEPPSRAGRQDSRYRG
jgi:AraC-like DNA-binding protein